MFKDSYKDIEDLTDYICSYVILCEGTIVPTRKSKVHHNGTITTVDGFSSNSTFVSEILSSMIFSICLWATVA